MALQDNLDASWKEALADEFQKPYWSELEAFVQQQREEHPGKIYPPEDEVFAALNFVPFNEVKVLLLGQDPYHGPGQAHGLSFSVKPGNRIPPSLRNIFKEMNADLGHDVPNHGSLTSWAQQGVLLLNTVLTVRHKEANSHKRQGWEKFTNAVVKKLAERDDPVVFLLWGGQAKKAKKHIKKEHHVIVESAHPSPLSAHNGFFGSKPFSQINDALEGLDKSPLNWEIANT